MNNLLYICFNRPDLVESSFTKLLEIEWDNILIVVDSARNEDEINAVKETILLVESLSNNHRSNSKIIIREINYGCRRNIELIVTKFFTEFRSGWVFEDDILLTDIEKFSRLRDYWKVKGHLALYNPVEFNSSEPVKITNGHYFIWGWFLNIEDIPNFRDKISIKLIKNIFKKRGIYDGLKFIFLYVKTLLNIIDTWDSIYTGWCINNDVPTYILGESLIKNIGFDDRATHTLQEPKKIKNIGDWEEKKWRKYFKKIV